MNLSEALARARNYTGMTQTELAVRSGITQQLIAKIERGQQKTTSYVPALARACGLSTEAFLSGSYGGSESRARARAQVSRSFKRITYHPDIPEAAEQGCPPASQATVTMIELHRDVLCINTASRRLTPRCCRPAAMPWAKSWVTAAYSCSTARTSSPGKGGYTPFAWLIPC